MKEHILQEVKKIHSDVYYVCATCLGVFDRGTDKRVGTLNHIKDATSHSICKSCARKQLDLYKEVNGMRLGRLIRRVADFCDTTQPKVENVVKSATQKVSCKANRLACKGLTLTHKALTRVNTMIESRIDTDDNGNPKVDPSTDPHYLDDEKKEYEKELLEDVSNIEMNG